MKWFNVLCFLLFETCFDFLFLVNKAEKEIHRKNLKDATKHPIKHSSKLNAPFYLAGP